jgi:hypothetical protein
MLKQLLLSALLATSALAAPAHAAEIAPPVAVAATRAALPSPALLTELTGWIAANFALPATADHPRIERVSPARMAAVRFRGLASDRQVAAEAGRLAPPEYGQDVYAVYDDNRRTIYLHEQWRADTPADVSVLVHELVHHLQNAAKMEFACPQEREKAAYDAQRAWLARFGTTIEQEFEIDAMSILVRTNCLG